MENSFRVRLLRTTMGMTHGELSKHIGIKQPALSKIENGLSSGEDHMEAIEYVWKQWRSNRISSLEREIAYLNGI